MLADADAILAGRALTAASPGDIFIIATGNVRHLARFLRNRWRPWKTIT